METMGRFADGLVVGQNGRKGARDVSCGFCLSCQGDGGAPTTTGKTEVSLDTLGLRCVFTV